VRSTPRRGGGVGSLMSVTGGSGPSFPLVVVAVVFFSMWGSPGDLLLLWRSRASLPM
jgi:hypothetical protein